MLVTREVFSYVMKDIEKGTRLHSKLRQLSLLVQHKRMINSLISTCLRWKEMEIHNASFRVSTQGNDKGNSRKNSILEFEKLIKMLNMNV